MTLKISDNLLKKMNDSKETKLKLSKNFEEKLKVQDEENLDISKMTFEEVKTYVEKHTAKVKSNYEAGEGGVIVVSFPQFVEMINDGYEIYKSEVLNKMFISIEYQKEMKKNKSR